MTDNNNTVVLNDKTTPTFVEMLHFAGLSPETWAALDEPRKLEWLRAWEVKQAETAQ